MRGGVALLLALLVAATGARAELRFEGTTAQGGLVIGRAAPGARVLVDGRPVRVTADGRFLVGFGRDAGPETTVEAVLAGGRRETVVIAVASRDWPVQRIDGLPPRKVTPPKRDWDRIRREGDMIKAARARDTATPYFLSGLRWPLRGRISGVFGSQRILNGEPRRPHSGVDIAAPTGTPVAACADGVVSLTHPDMFYTGMTVMVDHGHGLASVYVHLDSIAVTEGEAVARGQVLGTVGRTGRATGPHLHWGLSLFGTRLDPQSAVGPMDPAPGGN